MLWIEKNSCCYFCKDKNSFSYDNHERQNIYSKHIYSKHIYRKNQPSYRQFSTDWRGIHSYMGTNDL